MPKNHPNNRKRPNIKSNRRTKRELKFLYTDFAGWEHPSYQLFSQSDYANKLTSAGGFSYEA